MFWKFLVSVLILPSCLGFDIAAASIKNGVQTVPSEELDLPTQQIKVNRDVVNSLVFPIKESSSIQGVQEADTGQLRQITYQYPYLIAHQYYSHRPCLQGRRYYIRGYFYPEYADYHRSYYHNNGYYRHRNYYPQYYRHRYYHNNGYYRHGYYNHPYYQNNGYYRQRNYYPQYYHNNGYYRHDGYNY